MPLYQYRCEACRIRFEAAGSAARAAEPAACPGCSKPAPRALPGAPKMAYQAQAQGVGPQNTGLSGMDASYDRVIGQSAKQGWDAQRKRVADKRTILDTNPGARGEDIRRRPDNNQYEVMAPKDRGLHQAAQPLAQVGREAVRAR